MRIETETMFEDVLPPDAMKERRVRAAMDELFPSRTIARAEDANAQGHHGSRSHAQLSDWRVHWITVALIGVPSRCALRYSRSGRPVALMPHQRRRGPLDPSGSPAAADAGASPYARGARNDESAFSRLRP